MRNILTTTTLMLFLVSYSVLADGFGLSVTRVIFKGNSSSTTVVLRNSSAKDTYIVQARMSRTLDGFEQTPFTITPPIFRLEPDSTNNLRIKLNGSIELSQEHESVFYLNTRAIPATMKKDVKDGSNSISGTAQFGVGTIIKLFYRPKNLPGSSEEAQKNISFQIASNGLKVKNNSAFYVSFSKLSLAGESLLKKNSPAMIAPYSDITYITNKKSGKVNWNTINDFGGVNVYTTDL
ncbi:TPA: molecular chaperone [Klebsiella aerogenes]|nr:molecular chaperone [Klebsiella aerogenes]HCR0085222.1 molecular chaperone [Klebsiella aerogenes]HCR0223720.1 molecular chaperone [Klebsiella aerogenes]HCR0512068.1 molecular chaperone [Klebsiella aerogenes]HCU2336671.1 molecular chaperone [Klebsiella aerogenes]